MSLAFWEHVRIAAVADLHGYLPPTPPCDVLIVAGDICPAADHSAAAQTAWCEGPFSDWLEDQPASVIVGIAGNHDFVAESHPDVMRRLPWRYLCDESIALDGLTIHGSPWTPTFFDWAFMRDDRDLVECWQLIPADVDVLVTHGPPRGYGDRSNRATLEGSLTLLERLRQLDRLRLHVYGHIHEDPGSWAHGNATLANVTVVDADYNLVHSAHVFDL